MYRNALRHGKALAGTAQGLLRGLDPRTARQRRELADCRKDSLEALSAFSRTDAQAPRFGNVLIDGMWYNPNYWVRYALVRRALGLAAGRETGLLGAHSRAQIRASFLLLGITKLVDYQAAAKPSRAHLGLAKALLAKVHTPGDLLSLTLPYGFPPTLVFDGILKRQRSATVDLRDPELPVYLANVLAYLGAADALVGEGKFDLVILSHALDYTYSAIAWAAIRRQIPVLVLYGDFGTSRFFHLREASDLFAYPGRPTNEELGEMPRHAQELLRQQGASQLHARLSGQTDDLGAIYAYVRRRGSVDKASLAQRFGWDPCKPIVGVYNSNWFDYPHALGLNYFRDFLDWIEQTLAVARTHDSINWLFKAHPCDDWYASIKGTRLEDLIKATNLPHIGLADKSWNGMDLIRTLDGVVTCHGTIGIEATSLGTPVLTSYLGWYGHAGFVVNPGSRDGYLSALKTEWWKGVDKAAAQARAELFAGWMFCVPDWHGDYVLQDDSRQEAIYKDLQRFLEANAVALAREVREIRDWFDAGHRYFHVFKMIRAEAYQSGNSQQNKAGSS
jgi:hypothetical protein